MIRETFRRFVGSLGHINIDPDEIDDRPTVGREDEPVDLHLNAETLRWLHTTLAPDGLAHLNTVELTTEKGTIVFEAEGDTITLRDKDRENE